MKATHSLLLILLTLLTGTGCQILPRAATTPLAQKWDRAEAGKRAPVLVVYLPGRGDQPEAFAKAGFTSALRDAGAKVDTVALDAHLGYYLNRSVVKRLHHEVLRPARDGGYKRIVIVGVSLGAMGGLFGLRDHPDCIDGVVFLGPFVGEDRQLLAKVADGGDPATMAEAPQHEREIWTYVHAAKGHSRIWMGSGTEDRLGEGQRLLSKRLTPKQVRFVPGGHDWVTWGTLWRDWACHLPMFRS